MDKKTVSITVRVEEEIASKINQIAVKDERSVSFVVRKLLIQALKSAKP
jgi:predicted transcriptional regulator